MPDSDTTTTGLTKAEVNEMLAEHRRYLDDKLSEHSRNWEAKAEEHRRTLVEHLEGLSSSDKAEKEATKAMIEDHDAFVKEQRKKIEEADKVKGDKHTIVQPPQQVEPQQPPQHSDQSQPQHHQPVKRSGWKRFY